MTPRPLAGGPAAAGGRVRLRRRPRAAGHRGLPRLGDLRAAPDGRPRRR